MYHGRHVIVSQRASLSLCEFLTPVVSVIHSLLMNCIMIYQNYKGLFSLQNKYRSLNFSASQFNVQFDLLVKKIAIIKSSSKMDKCLKREHYQTCNSSKCPVDPQCRVGVRVDHGKLTHTYCQQGVIAGLRTPHAHTQPRQCCQWSRMTTFILLSVLIKGGIVLMTWVLQYFSSNGTPCNTFHNLPNIDTEVKSPHSVKQPYTKNQCVCVTSHQFQQHYEWENNQLC